MIKAFCDVCGANFTRRAFHSFVVPMTGPLRIEIHGDLCEECNRVAANLVTERIGNLANEMIGMAKAAHANECQCSPCHVRRTAKRVRVDADSGGGI